MFEGKPDVKRIRKLSYNGVKVSLRETGWERKASFYLRLLQIGHNYKHTVGFDIFLRHPENIVCTHSIYQLGVTLGIIGPESVEFDLRQKFRNILLGAVF
ncbi:hypothetical protein SBDP2_900003 [Syntrophobacter sp. SbD2]|nr:hypothetical protein SBDP2_900003 [Syntrophobacter sp. SbD2]